MLSADKTAIAFSVTSILFSLRNLLFAAVFLRLNCIRRPFFGKLTIPFSDRQFLFFQAYIFFTGLTFSAFFRLRTLRAVAIAIFLL